MKAAVVEFKYEDIVDGRNEGTDEDDEEVGGNECD
jgi:hypothetical protein